MSTNRSAASARPASANSTARRNRNRTVVVSSADEVTLVTLDQKVTQLGQTVATLNETVTLLSQSVAGILMTVQTMQDVMVKKFEAIDKRFDAVETEVKQIRTDVNGLGKDVTKIRTDVNGLGKEVTKIRKDMDGLNAYTKMESKIQEEYDVNFISKLYRHNYPIHKVSTLHTRVFYEHTSNAILTDLDGFLLINNHAFPQKDPLQPPPIRNTLTSEDKVEYIIIESKHSLDKGKIDKKIEQMSKISSSLAQAEDEKWLEGTSDKFKEMIHQLVNETRLAPGLLNRPIHLIFASDYITHEVGKYIEAISKGELDEAKYDEITKILFDSDPYVQPMMRQIEALSDGTISKSTKQFLKSGNATMADLRRIFANELKAYNKVPITPYLTPYSSLSGYFQERKGHIGLFQFGRVEHSELFSIKSLNQNALGP